MQLAENSGVFRAQLLTNSYNAMKTPITTAVLLAFAILISLSGFVRVKDAGSRAAGDVIDVGPFTEVTISISANVYIEQGSPRKLTIDADPSSMDKIVAEVENGNLHLELRKPFDRIKGDVTVHITVPELDEISVAGSANTMVNSTFNADRMALRIGGSGKINFSDLRAKDVEATISGSGKVLLAGHADSFDVNVAGSGKVEAFGFDATSFDGKISGSGKCNVNVSKDLSASIAGSGSIVYKGSPRVNKSVAGSGSVNAAQ